MKHLKLVLSVLVLLLSINILQMFGLDIIPLQQNQQQRRNNVAQQRQNNPRQQQLRLKNAIQTQNRLDSMYANPDSSLKPHWQIQRTTPIFVSDLNQIPADLARPDNLKQDVVYNDSLDRYIIGSKMDGTYFFGGVLGPLALMFGLTRTSGSAASLLLNLEAVLTAVIAWVVFKENADRRIVLGMLAIVAGGVVLSWSGGERGTSDWVGPLAIVAGCLCWAIDNNLTRRVSASDALFIAATKGAVAGTVNVGLAFALGASLPDGAVLLGTMVVGLFGYGISLVLFVLALRGLGTARTGAYFSTAPFIGAAVSLVLLGESTSISFWIAAALMGWGVWLHLTEHHEHEHTHEPMEHGHRHTHDEHHQHEHDFAWNSDESHEHWHRHEALVHKHPHFPDIHHRHSH